MNEFIQSNAHVLLLSGAALGWYIASHAAADALAGRRLAIGRRIVGLWIPIICTALLALLFHQTEVAVGVLLATSVAALSLVLGIVTFAGAATRSSAVLFGQHPDEPNRPIWAFVLPAALLALLAGFSGRLTLLHAAALLSQGAVVLVLVEWKRRRDLDFLFPDASDSIAAPERESDSTKHSPWLRAAQFLLAGALALIASWAGVRAGSDMSASLGLLSSGLVTSLMVAPALVLSMIGIGMNLSRAGLYRSAVTSSVGVVLLNLCVGLPLIVGVWYLRPVWDKPVSNLLAMTKVAPSTLAQDDPADDAPVTDFVAAEPALRYPLPAWRIDTVILILLGVALLPIAAGRWLPGRLDGVLLITVYVIYMGLTALMARA